MGSWIRRYDDTEMREKGYALVQYSVTMKLLFIGWCDAAAERLNPNRC